MTLNNFNRKQITQEGEITPTANPREAQLKAMFKNLAGSDNEIDSEELQDILTASLSKGMYMYVCVLTLYIIKPC